MPRGSYWNLNSGRSLASRHKLLTRLVQQNRELREAAMANRPVCRSCGKASDTVLCEECVKTATCPHGREPGCCDACDVEGDLAFDAWRERQ